MGKTTKKNYGQDIEMTHKLLIDGDKWGRDILTVRMLGLLDTPDRLKYFMKTSILCLAYKYLYDMGLRETG